MATLDTLREVVRDLLPSGHFWLSEAVSSYVEAMAASFVEIVDFIEALPDTINPLTAARAVLVDWWEYVRSTCSATPTDTEELRDRVLAALAAPLSYTFQGLQAVVSANVPGTVVLRELPSLSEVPFDVPSDVNEHARILEVWFSPLLTNEAQLRCVLGDFAQAADALRLVSPDTTLHALGTLASQAAFRWVHAFAPADIAVDRVNGATGASSSILYSLDQEDSAETLATVLSIAGGTDLAEDWLSWSMERDAVQVSATRTNRDAYVAAVEAALGRDVEHLFFGRLTGASGEVLTLESTATQSPAVGLEAPFDRVFEFSNLQDQAFRAPNNTIGNVTSSLAGVLLVKLDATSTGAVIGKMNGLAEGWVILIGPVPGAWSLLVVNTALATGQVDLTATSSTLGVWRALAWIIDLPNLQVRFGSDLETGTTASLPAGTIEASATPMRIGDARIPASTVRAIDGQVGPCMLLRGDFTGVSAQALAQAVRAALVV